MTRRVLITAGASGIGVAMAKAFVETGEQAFGKAAFQKALAAEYARRAAEVKARTPESWCLEERARLKDMGGGALFSK